jgi:hypothetical protein
MTPREVKLTKRVRLDYMIIGMAIGGLGKTLEARVQPDEMLTHVGRAMYAAAINSDRERFKDAFTGFDFAEGEGIGEGLIRILKESNVDQYAYAVGDQIAEQLASFDELADMIEILERATVALRSAKREREQCRVQ